MSAIDEVKQRLDIAEVASQYLALQKSGRNFRALCPFHTEKTPSFFIFPERQTWHCFGCGAGGDVLSLVMKKEGLDFGGALRLLAQRTGVALERPQGPAAEARQRLYDINQAAAEYYHRRLLDSQEAEEARRYLEGRGIGEEGIAGFHLGYSPRRRDALQGNLRQQGYSREEMQVAGLVLEREGELHDRFHDRITFPIRDGRGRTLGFGARALGEASPKYLNSPQTPLFEKGSVLYGLDRALSDIRGQGQAVVVEGYFDVLVAHQHGFHNVVASMGTAVTLRQVALFKGATASLVLALDADAAGDEATLRAIQVARDSLERVSLPTPDWLGASTRLQAEIRVAPLPPGQDPDDVISRSPQEWQRLVAEALPLMDYLIQAITSRLDLSQPQGRSRAAQLLLPYIAEMGDPVQRELYLGKLAHMLGVSERTLAQAAAGMRPSRGPRAARAPDTAQRAPSLRDPLEEHCLYLLLHHDAPGPGLEPDLFQRSENREVFLGWLQGGGLAGLRARLDPALWEHVEGLLQAGERAWPPSPSGEGSENALRYRAGLAAMMPLDPAQARQALAHCVRRLKERRLRPLAQALSTSEQAEAGLAVAQELKEIFLSHHQRNREVDAS